MNLNLRCLELLQLQKLLQLSRIIKILAHSKPTSCRIMIVKKPNLILEARYCGELIGEICNFFYLYVPFSLLSRFMSI